MKTFKTSKLGVRPRNTFMDVTAGGVYPLLEIELDLEGELSAVIIDDVGDRYNLSGWFIDEHFDWVVLP